jgi:hypothetical protein
MFSPEIEVNPPTNPVDREFVDALALAVVVILESNTPPSVPGSLNSAMNRNERSGSVARDEKRVIALSLVAIVYYLLTPQ